METSVTYSIVDVRTRDEYLNGHILNAVNIPVDEIPQRIHEFNLLPKPIVAYCRSGNRSAIAVTILKKFGIVHAINGGGLEDCLLMLNNRGNILENKSN